MFGCDVCKTCWHGDHLTGSDYSETVVLIKKTFKKNYRRLQIVFVHSNMSKHVKDAAWLSHCRHGVPAHRYAALTEQNVDNKETLGYCYL